MLYERTETIFILEDSPSAIDFHIRSGDYFLYLATLIGALEDPYALTPEQRATLTKQLRHDLRYVHANYEISPRAIENVQPVRPSGNLILRSDR